MRIREVIVVEGRYDKNTVAQAVDATIIETSGFGVFSNAEKLALLRKLGEKRGLILLTDSDRAGFFIRGRLRGMLEGITVRHAYIPDIRGREKRKTVSSKEGKLGVEGMEREIIVTALKRAGATIENVPEQQTREVYITKSDMYEKGLSGGPGSGENRRAFTRRLGLPERISANGLLDVLNALYSREEFYELFQIASD